MYYYVNCYNYNSKNSTPTPTPITKMHTSAIHYPLHISLSVSVHMSIPTSITTLTTLLIPAFSIIIQHSLSFMQSLPTPKPSQVYLSLLVKTRKPTLSPRTILLHSVIQMKLTTTISNNPLVPISYSTRQFPHTMLIPNPTLHCCPSPHIHCPLSIVHREVERSKTSEFPVLNNACYSLTHYPRPLKSPRLTMQIMNAQVLLAPTAFVAFSEQSCTTRFHCLSMRCSLRAPWTTGSTIPPCSRLPPIASKPNPTLRL